MQYAEAEQGKNGLSFELSLLNATKIQLEDKAKAIVNEVADGYKDPLQTLILAKKAIEVFTAVEKNVRPFCANENVGKGVAMFSAQIIEKKSPDTYDFTTCNDSTWNELKQQESDIKLKLKMREAFLKSLLEPVANTNTGEVINKPDVLYGKQTLAVTLK